MAKKKDKLKVYMYGGNTGVGLYRIHQPAFWMKKLGLAEIKTNEYRWGEDRDRIDFPSIEELNRIGQWADLIVFERFDLPHHIATFCGMGEVFNIPVVLETDDNIEAVRPHNPGYRGYHPKSEALMFGRMVPNKVNAITVTTDDLYKWHTERTKNKVYVLPNSINFDRFGDQVVKKPHPGKVNIGWVVSGAHFENYQIIAEAVEEIMEKHKNVILWTMDMYGSTIWDKVSPGVKKRIKRVKWGKTKNWPKTLASCSLDISLCPLMDNLFNRAKSNLRYLENATNRTTCIVSPVEAYKCVVDGKTGLVANEPNEWFDAMDKLITDQEFCKKLGNAAYDDAFKNFNQEKNAKMWTNAYQEIVDDFEKVNGPKRFIEMA